MTAARAMPARVAASPPVIARAAGWMRGSGLAWATLNLALLPSLFYGLHSDDTDTFYHLAAGRHMAEHGGVLDREVASFTIPGQPWTNYSWLFQRLLYAAHGLAGIPGVLAVRSLFVVLTLNLLFLLLWRRTGARPLATSALALLGLGLVSQRALQVRPHLASYLCLAALLVAIDRWSARPGHAAAAVLAICAAWANLHGIGYPVGMAVLAVAAASAWLPGRVHAGTAPADERRGRLLLLAAGCAGFLLNPFGLRLLWTPRVAADAEAMAQIGEMGRLPWEALAYLGANLEFRSLALVNVVVLGGLALVPTWIRSRAWNALGCFALGLGLLLFRGRRMVPELALLALPAIASGLAPRLAAPGLALRRVLIAVTAYLVAAAAVTTWRDVRSGLFEPVSDRLPHGPVARLERLDSARHVLADPTASGYVSWRLPHARIFLDMRMPEPFPSDVVWLYKGTGDDIPLGAVSARYGVDAVLVRADSALSRRLRAGADGFGLAYADHVWRLYLSESILAAQPEMRVRFLAQMDEIADRGGIAAAIDRDALAREAEDLVAVWPGNHLAQRASLWLRTSGGAPLEAARAARALADRHPRVAAYPFAEGVAWEAGGQPEAAADAYRRALRADAAYDPALAALARTLAALGRPGAALEALEELHERRRYRLDAADTAQLAFLRRTQGRLAEAASAYERALWLTPTAPQRTRLELDLALVCLQLGRWARALELAEAVLANDAADPVARLVRGSALLGRGGSEGRELLQALAADATAPHAVREAAGRALAAR